MRNIVLFSAIVITSICQPLLAPGAVHRARGAAHSPVATSQADIIPGTVVVKLRQTAVVQQGALAKPTDALVSAFAAIGAKSFHRMFPSSGSPGKLAPAADAVGLSRIYALDLPEGLGPSEAAHALAALPGVEYAEPKYYQRLNDTPNDPLLGSQAGALTRLNVFNAWSIAKGSASVVIADVDGGTDWRHEDLNANVHINPGEDINHNGIFDAGDLNGIDDDGNGFIDDVIGWNFTNATNDPSGVSAAPQSYAHGTATASHFGAVANNGKGMAGTSWNCSLMPICTSSATQDLSIAYGYEGIVYAFHNGANVINCSWGRHGGYSQFEQDVITAAGNAGALVVTAAGNDGLNNDVSPSYPASYIGVLAVGATNSTNDVIASFSNYGRTIPVFAPGVNIFSAIAGGGYGNGGSGTSYSSPLTAGLAGILCAAHPTWTPDQIAAQIRTTADPITALNPAYAGALGRGRVNFTRALSESHAALNLVNSDLRTTGGRKLFLVGDTLVLTLTLKNVLFAGATGCAVTVTSSDASLQVLNGTAQVASVAPGEEVTLPAFTFRVAPLASTREVSLTAIWTYNGTDSDAGAFVATLFPSMPLWLLQLDGSSSSLYSVNAPSPNVIWASGGNTIATGPLVIRSTNGGTTWTEVTGSLQGVDLYCVTALDDQRAWVGTSDGRIFATANGGILWSEQTYPGRQSPFIDGIRMFADGTGFTLGDPLADGKFVVLKTTDFGASWSHLGLEPGFVAGEAGWNNSFWWTDEQHGWFGTNQNAVWRTTDGGGSWQQSATGGLNSYGVAFNTTTIGYAVHDGGLVTRSTDGGQTWVSLAFPSTDQVAGLTSVPGDPSAWVVTASSPFHTRTNGSAWSEETSYPFSGSITHVSAPDSSIAWVVTTNGEVLCYRPSALTSVPAEGPPEVPAGYVLEQNYPNPFNPVTTIGYRVSGLGSGWVRLSVYDILGREVAVLANEEQQPGYHEVSFDGSRLSSGVYFYRLTVAAGDRAANTVVSTKRMLLLK